MTTHTAAAATGLPELTNPLLCASNTLDQAKGLCWAVFLAARGLDEESCRDALCAIEDALMEKLETIGQAIQQAREVRP